MNPIENKIEAKTSPGTPTEMGLSRKYETPASVTRAVPTTKCLISVWLNLIFAGCGGNRMFPVVDLICSGDVDALADLTALTRQVSEQS